MRVRHKDVAKPLDAQLPCPGLLSFELPLQWLIAAQPIDASPLQRDPLR